MTPEEKALSLFRQPPRHLNCAQTICATIDRDDLVENMQNSARGQAPGGTCGALFAAMTLAPERAESLRRAFEHTLGATTCAELKSRSNPCPRCVLTAVRLLTQTEGQS